MEESVTSEAVVVVIDDDASVRAALKDLFESVGLVVKLYASGSTFLEDRFPDATSCVVLDVRLPETSGIKIQEELSRAGVYVPIVFITGHAGNLARTRSRHGCQTNQVEAESAWSRRHVPHKLHDSTQPFGRCRCDAQFVPASATKASSLPVTDSVFSNAMSHC